jgi:alpha-tubulin suppressor-like RCC1 family protein
LVVFRHRLRCRNTASRYTPVQVTDLTDVVSVAARYWHSLALKADGTVWSWGYNIYGELGDGTTSSRRTPVQVRGLSDVVAINTPSNSYTSIAVTNSGQG